MSAIESTSLLDYYTSQSAITDPGDYRAWFDDLPRDLTTLMKLIQGLWLYTYEIPPEKRNDLLLRTIPKRLERLLALDPAPLTTARLRLVPRLCGHVGCYVASSRGAGARTGRLLRLL